MKGITNINYLNQEGIRWPLNSKSKSTRSADSKEILCCRHSDGEVILRKLAERIGEISTISSIDTLAALK